MGKFVNKVILEGQLNDIYVHGLTTHVSCVHYTLKTQESNNVVECFILQDCNPDFYRLAAAGKIKSGDWIHTEGFLNAEPNTCSNVICESVAVLNE